MKIDKGVCDITLTYDEGAGLLEMETSTQVICARLTASEMRTLAKSLTDAAHKAEIMSVAAFLSGGGA